MDWRPVLLTTLSVMLTFVVSGRVSAADCPGDLNADNSVTIDELITIVNVALTACKDAPADCPGDLNGDRQVTIDEIVKAVDAALNGCPPIPTATATVTPVPTPALCPYTFTDNTSMLGVSCAYAGPFTSAPTCPTELQALLISDGRSIVIGFASDPRLIFGAIANSATSATLAAYFIGEDTSPHPIGGTVESQDGTRTLIVQPDGAPPFNIGGGDCTFERYVGTFQDVVADPAASTSASPGGRRRFWSGSP